MDLSICAAEPLVLPGSLPAFLADAQGDCSAFLELPPLCSVCSQDVAILIDLFAFVLYLWFFLGVTSSPLL